MHRPKARTVRRACAALLVLLGILAGLELICRAAEPGPFTLLDRNPFLPDPILRHRHAPGFRGHWEGTWFEINSLGLRGPELPIKKAEGEYRVVCLGDSCTFGKSVEERETWPRQLEALLADELPAGRFPRVANLGINGFAGHEYREMFFRLGIDLDPDLVVIGYNLNDFPNVIYAVDQAVYKQRRLRRLISKDLRDWMGRTALYRWVRATYYEAKKGRDWRDAERLARGTGDPGQDPEIWARQEELLGEMVGAARDLGARVAVFLFPYESQVHLDSYDDTPIRLMRDLCRRLDVPFVDLAQRFRREARAVDPPLRLFVRGDRYHPTAEGYRIVAQAVIEMAREHGWLAAGG